MKYKSVLRCFLMAGLYCTSSWSMALETDQYVAWKQLVEGHELTDSLPIFNDYINGKIPGILETANKRKLFPYSCKDITLETYKSLGGQSGYKIIYWADNNTAVTRFPDDTVSNNQFYEMTIFRDNQLIRAPLARTVKMNGIYLGTDKLQHFISVGYSYYKNYIKEIQRGETQQEAFNTVLKLGVFTEESYLGQYSSGMFSYADLEANFQGLLFGVDLCEGDDPYLSYSEKGGWVSRKPIDMTKYLNPNWDESFNSSYYKPAKWEDIEKILLTEYCPLLKNDRIVQLRHYYQSILKPSLASVDLTTLKEQGDIPNNVENDISTVCH